MPYSQLQIPLIENRRIELPAFSVSKRIGGIRLERLLLKAGSYEILKIEASPTGKNGYVAPVAGMRQTPQPDTLGIFGPTEVVLVLRACHPLALAGGLRSPTAIRLGTEVLPPAIAGITAVLFVAMQALEGGFRTHRRVENKPPEPSMHALRNEENPTPAPPEEDPRRRRRKKSFE